MRMTIVAALLALPFRSLGEGGRIFKDDKITQIEVIFDNTGAVIESKQSSKGKYTSLSIMVNLANPDAVIEKYKEVGVIEGVISL